MDATNSPIEIDRTRILARLANDKELFNELVDIYREDYPPLLQKIEVAIGTRDGHELAQSAHAIKGLISNFLHDSTTAMALKLEKKGRTGDWDDIDTDFSELKQATSRLLKSLLSAKDASRS